MSDSFSLALASSSPRRRELLSALGVPFVVRVSDIAEDTHPGESPIAAVERLAEAKAAAVAPAAAERFIVGADTIVVCDGAILGKPADAAEARSMLGCLRGRRHEVTSGVAAIDRTNGKRAVGSLTTAVWMRDYAEPEVEAYIDAGEPFDKAGGYAIQDPVFSPVARIEGCYLNVVGFPICLLLYLLWQVGTQIEPPVLHRQCPDCVLSPRGRQP